MAGLVNILILNEIRNIEQMQEAKINQRRLRDVSNPFELPEKQLTTMFRLTKMYTLDLIEIITSHMRVTRRITAIPQTLRILTTLHFFGHGSYQLDVGQSHLFGLSQPSVSRCIAEVTQVIVDQLLEQWIKFPVDINAKLVIKQGFMHKYDMPGIIVAVDCTHIAIIAPPAEDLNYPGRVYYNRKGYTSINTQLICDADLNILNINARFPGSTHDSAIWMTSNIRRHLEHQFLDGDAATYLIGDSGYPLQPWLLTLVDNAMEGSPEERYNNRHIRARNCIDCLNGVFKSRFRCLLRHRTLNYGPIKSGHIIYAFAVLHNIANQLRLDPIEVDYVDDNNEEAQINPINAAQDGNWHADGERIRTNLIMNI